MLKKKKSTRDNSKIKEFKIQIEKYMSERNIMEILCNKVLNLYSSYKT